MTDEPKTVLDEDTLKYCLSIPQGRKLIWGIMGFSGLFRQPFVPGDRDATGLNSGALNVGLMLYGDCLAVSPDLTAMMTKEQGNDDNRAAADNRVDDTGKRNVSDDDSANGDHLNLGFDRSGG